MRLGVVLLPQERWARDRERWRRVEEWGSVLKQLFWECFEFWV